MLSESIINAIINHAEQGNEIAVITRHARPIIEQINNEVYVDAITRISRANGQEEIEFTNGARITFHLTAGVLRGRAAHLLVTPIYGKEDPLRNVIQANSSGVEVIGYM